MAFQFFQMTTAFWCVVIAAFMPFIFTGTAKFTGGRYNNHTPRDYLEKLDGFRKRAHWAQLNSFEIFPIFAFAVVIAHLTGGEQSYVDQLAMIFIVSRILYGVAYLADKALIRTLLWSVGILCSLLLFTAGG